TQHPTNANFVEYATALRSELDAFTEPMEHAHQVDVVHSHGGAAVKIAVRPGRRKHAPRILSADALEARAISSARARIEQTRSQWLYFDRNLIVYENDSTVILKPTQRVWWTRSQALADADELTLLRQSSGSWIPG